MISSGRNHVNYVLMFERPRTDAGPWHVPATDDLLVATLLVAAVAYRSATVLDLRGNLDRVLGPRDRDVADRRFDADRGRAPEP